ncbi:nucleoside-diphosphate sugar epimerase/dehydratase [Ramlibacter sp. PS3R-8]|uniref:polysaccharide biosynthesis protein n=1 Tax=Ramlibacter sp. PS3R-8 TaxID=3133437 RepID=UPI003099A508
MKLFFLSWPRPAKVLTVMLLDAVLAIVSMWVAFSLRLDTAHLPVGDERAPYVLAPILAIPIFVRMGLYRAIFRYSGTAALVATTQAVMIYGALLFVLLLWLRLPMVPRSVGVLQPLLFLLLIASSRSIARLWLADMGFVKGAGPAGRLLIYGADGPGVQTAESIVRTRHFKLLGFVDDDRSKVGRMVNGVPVIAASGIADFVRTWQVTDILLALPRATRERRNEIIAQLSALPVHVRTVPNMTELASGQVTVQDFRELDIEDLLGRDPVPPQPELLARNLAGKVVAVTGAGGSIGSELCRQIVGERPRRLLLIDHSEYALYAIHRELETLCQGRDLAVELVPLLASINDATRIGQIFRAFSPATVYHAAAYKHVPMVEHNPAPSVVNNVFGTLNVARAAIECRASHFVLVSTDKAVRPTNIMGASKRMAELVLQALAARGAVGVHGGSVPSLVPHRTCFSMVRFGNVLDSSGSVVPMFRQQVANGGPLTVTDPRVTRYFMTIPEAAQLVLQAGAMGAGGDVFVLDMGQPVRVMDLARRIIELSGLRVRDADNPQGDIEIVVIGLRPGEKLYEELLIGDHPEGTSHPRIMRAREDFVPWPELSASLDELWAATQANDVERIRAILGQRVIGYESEAGVVDHLSVAAAPSPRHAALSRGLERPG